ncbi:12889_t:CDS:2, partial [Acaulospora colombiana]
MSKGTVLLLKERQKSQENIDNNASQPSDAYETKLSSLSYSCVFLPVLSHCLLNIEELAEILKKGPENIYCGVIVTSQIAVEGLRLAWMKAFDLTADGNVSTLWKNLPFFAVGKSTSKMLRDSDFNVLDPESTRSGNSELLAEYIIQFMDENKISSVQPGASLLFLVGDKRRNELPS